MNISKLLISAMIVCGLHGIAHAQNDSTMDGADAGAAAEKPTAEKTEKKAEKGHGHAKKGGKKHH